jgi:hypothetical protein
VSSERGWFGQLLGFLARPWIWFTLVLGLLVWQGVLSAEEVTGLFRETVQAVKDWNPIGGGN